MIVPLLLIIVASTAAGAAAYGAHPALMLYWHGLDLILWSRRLQWPLISLSLLASIALIALAVSGRRRALWLFGLAPVLALFAHHFAPRAAHFRVLENPSFIAAAAAGLKDDDYVIGLEFERLAYAYPAAQLFSTPAILQSNRDKHLLIAWSAYANRILVLAVRQDMHARDLQVVGTPANALLLYDARWGQFINALTGQTPSGAKPAAVLDAPQLPASKTTWKAWRSLHPDTRVLSAPMPVGAPMPNRAIQPGCPMILPKLDRPASTFIALVGRVHPLAFESEALTAAPMNARADGIPAVVFRDGSGVHAFDRRIFDKQKSVDVIVQWAPNLNHRKHPTAFFVDVGSNTGWSAEGVCVDAPDDVKYLKGKRLTPLAVDDRLPWGVAKYWLPDLGLEIPPAAPIAVEAADAPGNDATRPAKHHRKKPRPGPITQTPG